MDLPRKDLVFEAFGFPLILKNCPIKFIQGAEAPDINYNDLMAKTFSLLSRKKSRLSGAEVRFVRTFLEMSQSEFAKYLNHSTHSLVSAWESKKLAASGMDLNTEIILRQKMGFHPAARLSFEDMREICEAPFQQDEGATLAIDFHAA